MTLSTVWSSCVNPKDVIPSVNRSFHSHRDLAAARSLSHGLVLDP